MLKISIISIGDEVRIGQVVNTNATWLSTEITKLGAFITNQITIGDDPLIIEKIIKEQLEMNDIVISTGGLGPTHDDITKQVMLDIFNDKLEFHQPTYENIRDIFRIRNREISEINRLQAYVPSKATTLHNAVGTAPGLMFKHKNNFLFVLPGVPAEMRYITTNSILPLITEKIQSKNLSVILYKTLNVIGIFESSLADEIGDVNEFLGENSTLAFLPSYKGIRLRIGTTAENFGIASDEIERIKKILYQKVGKYIYAEDETDLSIEIGKILSKNNLTVSVAESCTGGGLGYEFTRIPGSSKYFLGGIISYSNEVKVRHLNVRPETLVRNGAVSKETAKEMSKNCRKKFESDFAIAITGIAGPEGGTIDKPVGSVWISIANKKSTNAQLFHFGNDREITRERAIQTALLQFYLLLKENYS
jgi:nicotinamide-nucleotide amidase